MAWTYEKSAKEVATEYEEEVAHYLVPAFLHLHPHWSSKSW